MHAFFCVFQVYFPPVGEDRALLAIGHLDKGNSTDNPVFQAHGKGTVNLK